MLRPQFFPQLLPPRFFLALRGRRNLGEVRVGWRRRILFLPTPVLLFSLAGDEFRHVDIHFLPLYILTTRSDAVGEKSKVIEGGNIMPV